MTQIERRQARIRRICKRLQNTGNFLTEDIARTAEGHHNIGKSQNFPENIYSFLQKNNGDPAIKVVFYAVMIPIFSLIVMQPIPRILF
jgi:hypothetical protein